MLWITTLLLFWTDAPPPEEFNLEAESAEVLQWIDFLEMERQEQTRGALERATYFVPRFKDIFRQEGVPENLVWLALIESSFRNHATSSSAAVGMFQFKAETATAFGLKVNGHVDERRQPHAAARASARYLAYLRSKFDSWELVLAAYNLGEGDLRRAMQARDVLTWLEIKPFVREQTQNYVGKVKAAALIGNRHLAQFADNPVTPLYYEVRKGDTLYRIARNHGIEVDLLMQANGLGNSAIREGQTLLIPPATFSNQ
ncbi:Transglycosylase SLT domain-containing protein [Sulfidibacter corallicola]|uniref:Transglycosylase SLT domain-containing protein n=1 Tax=Sulfidibacter corallicola TaxID=2818388 RepID=A0A8A4TGA2_SULCO|nr:transglycosylase SLT domain-containing protein [Sulfidibacter corallicola]QTD48234.1 transglycosylase SLT domain-containing protein [Sulfidibacter corallicola]